MPQQVYYDVQNTRNGYIAALLADSANPQPSYSVGGQAVSRTEWRESLTRQVNEMNKLLSILNPQEIRSQIY